mmetsp:Transcript_10888/g.13637  ORF Transcript_10888/g.13637 Transcript_10888/m.13637 type:complete len:97 (+) Transcript_10888:271-561(+)
MVEKSESSSRDMIVLNMVAVAEDTVTIEETDTVMTEETGTVMTEETGTVMIEETDIAMTETAGDKVKFSNPVKVDLSIAQFIMYPEMRLRIQNFLA